MVDLLQTGEAMVTPLIVLWNNFVEIFPPLVAAIILMIVGYFIATVLGYALHKLVAKTGIDKKMDEAKLTDAIGHIELSTLSGIILKWYIFIMFLGQAANIVNLGTLSVLLNRFLIWLPNLIVAAVIVVFGLLLAEYAEVHMLKSTLKSVRATSMLVKVVIIFFILVTALKQIGLYVSLAENTFLILWGALCLAFAIAVGISFGFAFKEEAKGIINKFKPLKKGK